LFFLIKSSVIQKHGEYFHLIAASEQLWLHLSYGDTGISGSINFGYKGN
jgi:hypothetical protein